MSSKVTKKSSKSGPRGVLTTCPSPIYPRCLRMKIENARQNKHKNNNKNPSTNPINIKTSNPSTTKNKHKHKTQRENERERRRNQHPSPRPPSLIRPRISFFMRGSTSLYDDRAPLCGDKREGDTYTPHIHLNMSLR